jgi:beta-lactamase regulating signal transducer with metallopeptidase domain/HEAT repeat protein
MNIEFVFDANASSRLLLALAHSLWQGGVLAIIGAVFIGFGARHASAAFRHNAYLAVLLLAVLSPIVTFFYLGKLNHVGAVEVSSVGPIIVEHSLEISTDTPSAVSSMPTETNSPSIAGISTLPVASNSTTTWTARDFAPAGAGLYFACVLLMLARLMFGVRGGKRLRQRATHVSEQGILEILQRHAKSLGVRVAPLLAYSTEVAVPTVVGMIKPMILLPASFATGFPTEQLELLLLHELAHLRRYDHVLNLMQRVIESILFYNPAIWWLSSRVRFERELCCDDLVLRHGGDRRAYAASLLEAAHRAVDGRAVSLATALYAVHGAPTQLRRRVLRLLQEPAPPVRIVRTGWVVFGLIVMGSGLALAQIDVRTSNSATVAEIVERDEPDDTIVPTETVEQNTVAVPEADETEATEPVGNAFGRQDVITDVPTVGERPTDASEEHLDPTEKPANLPARTPEEPAGSDDDANVKMRLKHFDAAPEGLVAPVNELISQIQDENWWLRRVACQQLGLVSKEILSDGSIVGALVRALKDEDPRVASAAAESLGNIGHATTIKHLVAALYVGEKSGDKALRESAAVALARFEAAQSMPYLKLAYADPEVQRGAILALSKLGTPEALDVLLSGLPGDGLGGAISNCVFPSRQSSKSLYLELRENLSDFAPDQVIARLEPMLGDPDWIVRASGLLVFPDSLLVSGDAVRPSVARCVSDPNINVRAVAVSLLGSRKSDETPYAVYANAIRPALRDTNRALAAHAAALLSQHEWQAGDPEDRVYYAIARGDWDNVEKMGPTAVPILMTALRGDYGPMLNGGIDRRSGPMPVVTRNSQDRSIERNIVTVLGHLNALEAVPDLIAFTDDTNQDLRRSAMMALTEIDAALAFDTYMKKATHEDDEIRYYAAVGLAKLKRPESVDVLIALLGDDENIAREAVSAFVTLPEPRAYPALKGLFDTYAISAEAPQGRPRTRSSQPTQGPQAARPQVPRTRTASTQDDWKTTLVEAMLNTGGQTAVADLHAIVLDNGRPVWARQAVLENLVAGNKIEFESLVGLMNNADLLPTVAVALGNTHDDRAIAPLAGGLLQSNPYNCFEALARLDSEKSADALADWLPQARNRGAEQLSEFMNVMLGMKTPRALDRLIDLAVKEKMFSGGDWIRIVEEATKRGNKNVEPLLRALGDSPEFRVVVNEALKTLGLPLEPRTEVEPAEAPK